RHGRRNRGSTRRGCHQPTQYYKFCEGSHSLPPVRPNSGSTINSAKTPIKMRVILPPLSQWLHKPVPKVNCPKVLFSLVRKNYTVRFFLAILLDTGLNSRILHAWT